MTEPVGKGKGGKDVYLGDIWPTSDEIHRLLKFAMNGKAFRENYAKVRTEPGKLWEKIKGVQGDAYTWPPAPTSPSRRSLSHLLQNRSWSARYGRAAALSVQGARIMALFGDSITTDHISPAGSIKESSPAGQWLLAHGVKKADFNSYGARRGNHDVMMRGTFANVRIKNLMIPPRRRRFARGGRRHAVPRRPGSGPEDVHLRRRHEVHGRRRAHRDLCRRGIRHRLQPRLGGQGHAAAGHQGRGGQKLRAHPPQQPGGHGRAAAAVQGRRVLADAGLRGDELIDIIPAADLHAAKRRAAGHHPRRRQPQE
jgi:hypothetical protein